MYTYKLTRIKFNDGTEIVPGKLTVLIGPNGVGKSRGLKDIATICSAEGAPAGVVVHEADWTHPNSIEELGESYDVERFKDQDGNWSWRTLDVTLNDERYETGFPWPDGYKYVLNQAPIHVHNIFGHFFGQALVAYLKTETRLTLVQECESPVEDHQVKTLLQHLFNAGPKVEFEIRRLVQSAFDQDVMLDFTTLGRLLLRVSKRFKDVPGDPREAKPILEKAGKLDDQGDGLRSFVSVAVAMLSLRRSLFLIDEPEAFLHPPQAFRMGAFLTDQALNGKQLIVATHSADVLRGILSRTDDVTIIRIDRQGNSNVFRQLNLNSLRELMSDPLLSSARVLEGLFYSGAVVVEADSDSRFYQVAAGKRRRDHGFHFVNAGNKQTVPRIIKLYRELGVRAASIVDIDVLNDKSEFEQHLIAIGLPTTEIEMLLKQLALIAAAVKDLPLADRIRNIRCHIEASLQTLDSINLSDLKMAEKSLKAAESKCREASESNRPWKLLKQEGIKALPDEGKAAYELISKTCVAHGLFINPCGELESMLVDYSVAYSTDKRKWITTALPLVANLEVDDKKQPWTLIKAFQEYVLPENNSK
jgi:predicted ATPase